VGLSGGPSLGGCLCGAVRFEVSRFEGPFELCHCPRCRKASGSAFVSGIRVRAADFRWLSGEDQIQVYEAPVRDRPPPYATAFCRRCGSPTPPPPPLPESFEVSAGLLEGDAVPRPDRHILVEHRAGWHEITDTLPQLDRPALDRLRSRGQPGPRGRRRGV
jgi:hypothetical protein